MDWRLDPVTWLFIFPATILLWTLIAAFIVMVYRDTKEEK